MKETWNWIQLGFSAVGGFLGWFLGGVDGLLYTLIAFVVVDYITGVLRAIAEKKLSSKIGAHGITKKIMIFLLVGVAHMLDVEIIGNGSILRDAVIFFYISNEGISLLENASKIGLPIPQKLTDILEQLHDKKGDN
jgi:toxin secretion/phage lysis holin